MCLGFFFSGLQTRNLLFFTLRSFIRVSFKHGKCNGLGWEYMDWRYSFLSIDFFSLWILEPVNEKMFYYD